MNILRSCDIEDEIRKVLKDYLTVYVRPLPEKFTVPSILVSAVGGSSVNEIDTFRVVLDARAKEDSDAYSLARTAQGLLEALGKRQFGLIRDVRTDSLASWGNDPVRPDLKLCTLTCIVTAHKEKITI